MGKKCATDEWGHAVEWDDESSSETAENTKAGRKTHFVYTALESGAGGCEGGGPGRDWAKRVVCTSARWKPCGTAAWAVAICVWCETRVGVRETDLCAVTRAGSCVIMLDHQPSVTHRSNSSLTLNTLLQGTAPGASGCILGSGELARIGCGAATAEAARSRNVSRSPSTSCGTDRTKCADAPAR